MVCGVVDLLLRGKRYLRDLKFFTVSKDSVRLQSTGWGLTHQEFELRGVAACPAAALERAGSNRDSNVFRDIRRKIGELDPCMKIVVG